MDVKILNTTVIILVIKGWFKGWLNISKIPHSNRLNKKNHILISADANKSSDTL